MLIQLAIGVSSLTQSSFVCLFSYEDHKMDIIAPIIVVFVIFMICTCCGLACKRKREGAIFSSEYQRKMIHRCSAWILCQVDDIIVIRNSCRNEPVANFVILLSRQYIGDYCVLQTWKGMFRIIVIKWNEIDPN